MDIVVNLIHGFYSVFTPINLLMITGGCLCGLMIGLLPGVSAATGIALMLPAIYAFKLSPDAAVILLAAIYYGTNQGIAISYHLSDLSEKTLTFVERRYVPASDQDQIIRSFSLSLVGSPFGGFMALLGVTLVMGSFVDFSSRFGPAEYVAVISFAFVLTLVLLQTSLSKNLIGLCLGLLISVIGLDSTTGVLRFTFGIPELYNGIDFITVVIGLVTIGDALTIMEESEIKRKLKTPIKLSLKRITEAWSFRWTLCRASLIGFIIGVLPGTGRLIAGSVSHQLENRLVSGESPDLPRHEQSVLASETSASAASVGAFVPLLALGIPGSATTAVLLGAMTMINLSPGPMFYDNHSGLIWALIASLMLGSLLLLLMNLILVRYFIRQFPIPKSILLPILFVASFVGVYAIQRSMISLALMLGFGLFSYALRKFDYSLVPLILGYILGKPFEIHLRRSLAISGGNFSVLFQTPFTITLWGLMLIFIVFKLGTLLRNR